MSLQELEIFDLAAPTRMHLRGEHIAPGSFAEAAEMSHGRYDTPEQKAERIAAAHRLEETMVAGASVIHQKNRLDIQAGTLLDAPRIITLGENGALGFEFDYLSATGPSTSRMSFTDLIYGTRYGAEQHIPEIAAGTEDVKGFALSRFVKQRYAEAQEGGIPWHDISPLTEMRTYEALTNTDVRLSDVVTTAELTELRTRYEHDATDPSQKHIHPLLHGALLGLGGPEGQPEIEQAPESPHRRRLRRVMGAAVHFLTIPRIP